MRWRKVSEEIPPVDEDILFGFFQNYGQGDQFKFERARVIRPFDRDDKWNPAYYYVLHSTNHDVKGDERKLERHHFWSYVENPSEEGDTRCHRQL